jgi:hypothetical protein
MNHPPLHTLPWAEVEALAEKGETLVSRGGYLLQSRDRKWDPKRTYYIWSADVDNAIHHGDLDPADDPKTSEERRKSGPNVRPKEEIPSRPVNPKGKRFSWSPSAINDFLTCPRQYAARRFYETLPYVETEAQRQGNIEHKHIEDRLRDGTPLPDGYTRGELLCRLLEARYDEVIAEQEIAISEDMQFVRWFDKAAWGRTKIDVTALKGDTVAIYDHKTGKKKDDPLQLKIYACIASLKYPEAQRFVTRFHWLKELPAFADVKPAGLSKLLGKALVGTDYTRDQIPGLWAEIHGYIQQMEDAWRSEVFNCRPSGLCRGWCGVTDCPHNEGKK